jgi:hypothetical protein
MYARVDIDGNVTQFPIYSIDSISIEDFLLNESLPSDIVEVDVVTNRPTETWNQKLIYGNVENVGGEYRLNYTVSEKFSDLESKKNGIEKLIKQYSNQNELRYKQTSKNSNSKYSEDEVNTWTLQLTEAKNYLNGVNDYTFITKLSQKREIELSDFANKIVEKHNSYVEDYGNILGIYQKNRELLSSIDLNDETTFDSIDQYGW